MTLDIKLDIYGVIKTQICRWDFEARAWKSFMQLRLQDIRERLTINGMVKSPIEEQLSPITVLSKTVSYRYDKTLMEKMDKMRADQPKIKS